MLEFSLRLLPTEEWIFCEVGHGLLGAHVLLVQGRLWYLLLRALAKVQLLAHSLPFSCSYSDRDKWLERQYS